MSMSFSAWLQYSMRIQQNIKNLNMDNDGISSSSLTESSDEEEDDSEDGQEDMDKLIEFEHSNDPEYAKEKKKKKKKHIVPRKHTALLRINRPNKFNNG